MAGIEIVKGDGCKENDPALALRISALLWKAGLWCQLQSGTVFRIGPRINCTSDEIARGLEVLEQVFDRIGT